MKTGFLAVIGIGMFAGAAFGAEVDPATGISLPSGFKATVFADNLGTLRHAIVRPDGVLYVARRMRRGGERGGLVALQDTDGDGVADVVRPFFESLNGTGMGFYKGFLYYSDPTELSRVAFEGNELVPKGEPQLMISFPVQSQHASKPFTFDGAGNIYVNVGAPSNACQVKTRSPGSPGQDPCPQLVDRAGIYRFPAEKPGQVHVKDAHQYATGIRNAMGLDWNFEADALYFSMHGRDSLSELWPEYFTEAQRVELPAEEIHMAVDGSHYGWPYSYWDHRKLQRMQGPEYGGDGTRPAENKYGKYKKPIHAFPGHWAPNDFLFYTGDAFGLLYKGGAFIAFHGSWNRAPQLQAGYKVVFLPFADGKIVGKQITFADGFAGTDKLKSPRDARFRPMGLAMAPDGALFITDSMKGRIWRVTYEGD